MSLTDIGGCSQSELAKPKAFFFASIPQEATRKKKCAVKLPVQYLVHPSMIIRFCVYLTLLPAGSFVTGARRRPQRDEQRDARRDRDLLPVQQPAAALPVHQSQLTAETQGKIFFVLYLVVVLK